MFVYPKPECLNNPTRLFAGDLGLGGIGMEIKDLKTAADTNPTGLDYVSPIQQTWRKRNYIWVKRVQDIFLSTLALVVLSPVLLLIAMAVLIDDPHGSPFFAQIRCGKMGKKFRLYKFRTMCVDAEQQLEALLPYNEMSGPAFKMENDPRITRFGRFLRSTGLDELPQLVNILKGDMSIVGPRPPLPREVAKYTPYQLQRLLVLPGLTCYWQVYPARNKLDFDTWMELDLRYIREQSWRLDWKLIFQTLKAVVNRDGI